MFKKVLVLSLFLVLSKVSFASTIPQEVMEAADKGVAAIYNLDFETANHHIGKLLAEHPDFPIALFGKTMIEWGRFEYEYEKSNPEQTKIFENTIEEAREGIKRWMKNNEPDASAYLALGGVYGVKARFDLANKSYASAYFSGKKGIKFMNRAAKIDPEMYDAYLGEGIFQYYAGTLPAVVKVLAKLVISGNADKGIEHLNTVKENGHFAVDAAKLILVEISIESKKYYNPSLAAQYVSEVSAKYPKNPLFKFVSIIADYENKDYDSVISSAQDFLSKIGKEPFYNDIYTARSYTAIGTSYMQKGQYEKAKEVFEKSIAATSHQEESRWQLWNELRLAQTYDVLGERDKAVALYKAITKKKKTWEIDEVASKHIKKPFTADTEIGRMSPP